MPEDLRAMPRVVGVKQIRRALRDGKLCKVYLAEDADPALLAPIRELCREKNIPVVAVPSMAELGKACGISVSASAAGILAIP